ncbi:MAG: AAA family ATPase, partial [Bacteroidetes bacterium]|nr:AAA family ATPase [Bacteroidota bacterium]
MILEFSLQNYRSFKEKTVFSLVAESSKSKGDNVFDVQLPSGDEVRLLNSAVIYGPNASGKSNLLKALSSLKDMVLTLSEVGSPIREYDPFLFNSKSKNESTHFSITFIGPNNHKYHYHIEFNHTEVINEKLEYYPKGQKKNLFKRSNQETIDQNIHRAKVVLDQRKRELQVFKNQTLFSKFGKDTPDKLLSSVYLYFKQKIHLFNNHHLTPQNYREVEKKLSQNPGLLHKLSSLIKISDTKIDEIVLRKSPFQSKPQTSSYSSGNEYEPLAKHSFSEKSNIVAEELPLYEESKGTNVLYILGTYLLETLEKGGVFLIDEFDTSLHPQLAKFLVRLFQHPKTNPQNAQIIFTTHETTFLDKDVFRKDQIWFVEKNDLGESELFSIQDFDGVRETTPFEKWYLAGK